MQQTPMEAMNTRLATMRMNRQAKAQIFAIMDVPFSIGGGRREKPGR